MITDTKTTKKSNGTNTMLGTVAKHQLELAIAQLTGWNHAKMYGDRIIDLIESMGLKKEEWKKIRKEVEWLKESDRAEIEAHFRKRQ